MVDMFFPSGVGIISHHRYTEVLIGWEWSILPSDTSNVLVASNYIHDIGRYILCDQGRIYTLRVQPGTMLSKMFIVILG